MITTCNHAHTHNNNNYILDMLEDIFDMLSIERERWREITLI